MTLQEAIQELHEMREDTSLPVYYALSITDVIDTLLTDVQEVRHGRWILHGTAPWLVVECSNCGAKWHHWSGEKTNNYCGECGAKMEERE